MHVVTATDFSQWRQAARKLLASAVPPDEVLFQSEPAQRRLFESPLQAEKNTPGSGGSSALQTPARVSRAFVELARDVACHRSPERFDRLYRVLWRLTHGEACLLEVITDDDVHRLLMMQKAVRRDSHKMKAFVRFRRLQTEGREQFIAWHRPDHCIVRLVGPFFARRFPAMDWTILTPDESVSWNQQELRYGPGVSAGQAPHADELEDLWRTYYASIFNPARIKLKTMIREMPLRHWKTLPETQIVDELLADAPRRVAQMIERQEGSVRSAADFLPDQTDLDALRAAAVACRGCDLHCHATQTVFGEGPAAARVMLVGEQPGDAEDIAGRPFVGPAGQELNDALQVAGLEREMLYVTNAVKHFKYTPRGKRRLHQKPDSRELTACRPWVEAEIRSVQPDVLVCLGATAAQVLIGRDFRITRQRGAFLSTPWCESTIATYHPSAILRAQNAERAADVRSALQADLQKVARLIASRD